MVVRPLISDTLVVKKSLFPPTRAPGSPVWSWFEWLALLMGWGCVGTPGCGLAADPVGAPPSKELPDLQEGVKEALKGSKRKTAQQKKPENTHSFMNGSQELTSTDC